MDSAQMIRSTPTAFDAAVQEELFGRLQTLRKVSLENGRSSDFARFLGEVDAALKRFEEGTYGECADCHDAVEPERLMADPLMRVCLGCLTDQQRASLEDDLQLAFDIQQGLLPQAGIKCDKWHVYHAYEPAGIVSGDYVDIIEHGDEFYFLLGDVSGKGMAASLLMSNLHAAFHSLVPMGLPMTELMKRANRLLCESSLSNQYATLICGRANRSGEVALSNAGHPSPIVVKDGVKAEVDEPALPLGMFCEAEFPVTRLNLTSGDSIVLFSDGVTETVNSAGVEFGTQRLFEAINGGSAKGPDELVARCLERVSSFRGAAGRRDDLTMLAVTYL
jgi:phosphoserine phosphatase RsbU/P